MVQCQNCGMELEENANYCSLCGEPLLHVTTENTSSIKSGRIRKDKELLTDYLRLTSFQKRKIFWQISGLILISGLVITLLIDFVMNKDITWSKYSSAISLVLFINFTLITFLRKKIFLMVSFSFLSVTGLFMLFDIYAGRHGWEAELGIPLLLAFYLSGIALIYMIRKSKQKGMNVIAFSLIAAGLFCIYTEGMISVFRWNALYFEWSLIAMLSVVPVAMLLLYVHYRLKRATDLKRFFHI